MTGKKYARDRMGESGGISGDLPSLRTDASIKADSTANSGTPRACNAAAVCLSLELALSGVSGRWR